MKRLLCALFLACLPFTASWAQGDLPFNEPVRGEVAPGQIESHSFSGRAGQVISILVNSAGTLDPALALLNAEGEPILTDDDFAWPETGDSLLQAVTLPYTGRYTIQVSGFADTAGQYTLVLGEGYALVAEALPLTSSSGWQPTSTSLQVQASEAGLTLTVEGVRANEAVFGVRIDQPDLSAAVDVSEIRNSSGWIAGLALRRTGDSYYAVQINNEGRWRFILVEGDSLTIVRDWTSHPAVVAGQSEFRLGAFIKGSTFDFFYDGTFIGTISDDTLTEAGDVGLSVGTVSSLNSTTLATFSNLAVTTPLLVDGQMPAPQQILLGDGRTMAQALSRRTAVQGNGEMMLTVPEASVSGIRPGVNTLLLGQATEFADFAYGGTVRIQQASAGATGCGLVVRSESDDSYALAWLDAQGAFGLSPRNGEEFEAGLYGQLSGFRVDELHHLLVIASGPILDFYVDGVSAGRLEVPLTQGQVGTAVATFEGIDTTCQFSNLWLWQWE